MLAEAWWRLIRFGFRLLYNELAWTYDAVSAVVSLGDWRGWQRAALPYLGVTPGARVLELAHGTGNLQIDLRTAGVIPVGLDLSPHMGRIARGKLARHRLAPRLVRGRGQALPFPAESFPAVVSTFPTEFIIDPFTVGEVYRVLAPGGRFVIVINGLLTGGGIVRRMLEWAYRVTGQRGPWPGDPLRVFGEAGFALKQVEVSLARSRVLLFVATRGQN